jgi:hypothetical protein
MTSPGGRRPAGRTDVPSSHTHLHEALLQVRYESEGEERGPELPIAYGLDRCVLLVKEPETITCYWELSGHALERAQATLSNDEYRGARLVLRLFAGDREQERRDLAPFRPGERATFFSVAPDTEYRVELGLEVAGGKWLPVVTSNAVRTPRRV